MFDTTVQTLLLSQLPNVGVSLYWQLVSEYETFDTILSLPRERLSEIFHPDAIAIFDDIEKHGDQAQSVLAVQNLLGWAKENQVQLLDHQHEAYPDLLHQIKRAPPILYVKGEVANLRLPQLAIVGSRHPSTAGKSNAASFACELATHGYAVTSGLALGIDAAAHRGALNAGGKTIAVVATGIDQVYPARNSKLAAEILAQGGTIVSEFPVNTQPMPANFPQRNRIISGMSDGTLVVEAAVKSGSLITARYAVEQDREVFAIPGSIHNPLSRGCHALIKQGAHLIESAQDIVDELQGFLAFKKSLAGGAASHASTDQRIAKVLASMDEQAKSVYELLGFEPTPVDNLAEQTGLRIDELTASLVVLELNGLVEGRPGGYQRLGELAPQV